TLNDLAIESLAMIEPRHRVIGPRPHHVNAAGAISDPGGIDRYGICRIRRHHNPAAPRRVRRHHHARREPSTRARTDDQRAASARHSTRTAIAGSIAVARSVGTTHATIETTISSTAPMLKENGSKRDTP